MKKGLSYYTREFIKSCKHYYNPGDELDMQTLKDMSKCECRRRIYDVTSVLCALGMLKKRKKGIFIWKGLDSAREHVKQNALSKEYEKWNEKQKRSTGNVSLRVAIYIFELNGKSCSMREMMNTLKFISTIREIKNENRYTKKYGPRPNGMPISRRLYDVINILTNCELILVKAGTKRFFQHFVWNQLLTGKEEEEEEEEPVESSGDSISLYNFTTEMGISSAENYYPLFNFENHIVRSNSEIIPLNLY